MLLVQPYSERISRDYYGGSLELVEDGITALRNQLLQGRFESAAQAAAEIEKSVDMILACSTAILPLINLLSAAMGFVEAYKDADIKAEAYVSSFVELLEKRRAAQNASTKTIGAIGARLVRDGDTVGTFSTSGTVASLFEQAVAEGKRVQAVAFEARPHSEGYRTLDEISALGVPVTFGVDALLCALVPRCNLFFIGVDAITAVGDVYAKTGSYLAALACREFGIPFYIVADTSKFDPMSLYGYPLKDSERPYQEVADRPVPAGSCIKNISFELVPAHLIKGIITEKGLMPAQGICQIMEGNGLSPKMVEKLDAWLKSEQNLLRKD